MDFLAKKVRNRLPSGQRGREISPSAIFVPTAEGLPRAADLSAEKTKT